MSEASQPLSLYCCRRSPRRSLVRAPGFKPGLTVWKTAVLSTTPCQHIWQGRPESNRLTSVLETEPMPSPRPCTTPSGLSGETRTRLRLVHSQPRIPCGSPNISLSSAGTDSRVDRPCTYRAVYPRRCLELVPGLKPRPCRLQGGCTVSRARPASLALRGGIEPPTSPLPKVRSTY